MPPMPVAAIWPAMSVAALKASCVMPAAFSSDACCNLPKPLLVGLPVVAVPEAAVSRSKLSPMDSSPAGFAKVAN